MKKILMISNTASMQYQFLFPWTQLLREMGYEVHIACNFKEGNNCSDERVAEFQQQLREADIPYFQIDFDRNAMKLQKYRKPLRQLTEIVQNDTYTAIHCHSPVGGVCGRIIGKRESIKVLYTAHGFHFFKGASPLHWLAFYPVERLLAHWTDTLITINHEDFEHARKFHAGQLYRIPGAGVELERYRYSDRSRHEVLTEMGIPDDALVFLSIGETNANKNHAVLIRALHRLHRPDLHLVVAGTGRMTETLQKLAKKLHVAQQVHFLGFRRDVPDLLHAADVFCFPSRREGLGFTAIEAMAAGLPLITSNRHGILDYSVDGVTGFVCPPDNDKAFANAMQMLADDAMKRKAMGRYNARAAGQFALAPVLEELREIYIQALGEPDVVEVPETTVQYT